MNENMTFADYFEVWVNTYKKGFVRKVTVNKYLTTLKSLRSINPNVKLKDLNRLIYQQIINKYAETHERQTVQDFHTQLKASIKDAVYEEYIKKDVTYGVVVKGLKSKNNAKKYLDESEYRKLLAALDLKKIDDALIHLLATTGMRFSEAIALTLDDIDFENNIIRIKKSWNYKFKDEIGFDETKNKSSERTIIVDDETIQALKNIYDPENFTLFVKKGKRIYNSTYNKHLKEKCREASINEINIHSLRHTHASLMIKWGISINTIADRLGHSDTVTTQKVYSHIIRELQERDNKMILNNLSSSIGEL